MRNYWYIKHTELGGLHIHFGGNAGHGYSIGIWSGFPEEINNITQFKDLSLARIALEGVRAYKTKKFAKKFKLVKVSVSK